MADEEKLKKTDSSDIMNRENDSDDYSTSVKLSGTGYKLSAPFPSRVSANYLCNFMPEISYLKTDIKDMSLKPRYFKEDIQYLGINDLDIPKSLVYPMLCFCDIPLSKVSVHMKGTDQYTGYGDYGIALRKEFCESQDIQPVMYLNPESRLAEDIAAALRSFMKADPDSDQNVHLMADFLTSELMYTKPIQGFMQRDEDKDPEERLFKDECEWRYIPKIPESSDLPLYIDEKIASKMVRNKYSDALNSIDETNFHFTVDDIVYIIVKDESSALEMMRSIKQLRKRSLDEKDKLISKIEIAENFDKNLV